MSTKIASIHFAPVEAHRIYRALPYKMPAVEFRGSPEILETQLIVQVDEGPFSLGPGGGRRQQRRDPVTPEEIAHCLVREWTEQGRGMGTFCHPGIWVVREQLPVTTIDQKNGNENIVLDALGKQIFRAATPEEREQMWQEDLQAAREADRVYAEWCWADGNDIAGRTKTGNGSQTVPPNYKRAARQYGLDAEWLKEAAAFDSRKCPHCEKLVSKTTMICQFCTQPIDLERWAGWMAKKEAALDKHKLAILDAQTSPHVSGAALPPGPRGISNKAQAQV